MRAPHAYSGTRPHPSWGPWRGFAAVEGSEAAVLSATRPAPAATQTGRRRRGAGAGPGRKAGACHAGGALGAGGTGSRGEEEGGACAQDWVAASQRPGFRCPSAEGWCYMPGLGSEGCPALPCPALSCPELSVPWGLPFSPGLRLEATRLLGSPEHPRLGTCSLGRAGGLLVSCMVWAGAPEQGPAAGQPHGGAASLTEGG